MKVPARAVLAFAIAFELFYPLCVLFSWSLFRYYPSLHRFTLGPLKGGHNAIQWYGWLADAALGALVVAAIAWFVPTRAVKGSWSAFAWLVPVGMLLFSVYVVYRNWWPL